MEIAEVKYHFETLSFADRASLMFEEQNKMSKDLASEVLENKEHTGLSFLLGMLIATKAGIKAEIDFWDAYWKEKNPEYCGEQIYALFLFGINKRAKEETEIEKFKKELDDFRA